MKIKRSIYEKIMQMKPEDQPIIHKDHKLKTRRDFLGQGLISGMAIAAGPSLYGLISADIAMAAEGCEAPQASAKTPVLIIDLAGGYSLGANFILGGAEGQHDLLNNYRVMGFPDVLNPANDSSQINTDFGVKMHASSGVLAGMLEQTASNTALRSKVDGGVFLAQSENDRATNPLNPVFWLAKAGALGDLAATAGTEGSMSGGRSVAPAASFDPTISPVQIRNPGNITNLINLGQIQAEFGNNGVDKAKKVLKRIEAMSVPKIQSFTNQSLSEQLKQVAECGFDTSRYTEGSFNAASIDPAQDSDISAVYGPLNNSARREEASMVKAVVDGLVGVGTLEMGGYDYHGQSRESQDGRDLNVGRVIGRALTMAARKATDLMIYIITDGGVALNTNSPQLQQGLNGIEKYRHTGDNSARTGVASLVYRHNASSRADILRTGTANLDTAKRQVGSMTDVNNPSVSTSDGSLIAGVGQVVSGNLAAVLTANYMALHGQEAQLLSVVGSNYQSIADDLEKYLLFKAG